MIREWHRVFFFPQTRQATLFQRVLRRRVSRWTVFLSHFNKRGGELLLGRLQTAKENTHWQSVQAGRSAWKTRRRERIATEENNLEHFRKPTRIPSRSRVVLLLRSHDCFEYCLHSSRNIASTLWRQISVREPHLWQKWLERFVH